jgi:hypothetical protein
MCDCKVGPGKFEGESALTFIGWQSALMGLADVATGVDETVDWFRAPFNFDADVETVKAARDYGYCEDCIREALADDSAGLSLWESSAGFVYGTTYATRDEFDKALADAEQEDEDEQ